MYRTTRKLWTISAGLAVEFEAATASHVQKKKRKTLHVDEKQCSITARSPKVAYCWLPLFIRVRLVGRGPAGVAPREAPDSLCNVFFFSLCVPIGAQPASLPDYPTRAKFTWCEQD